VGNIAVAQILRFFNNNLKLVVFQKKLNQIIHKNRMVSLGYWTKMSFLTIISTPIGAKIMPKTKNELSGSQQTIYISNKIQFIQK